MRTTKNPKQIKTQEDPESQSKPAKSYQHSNKLFPTHDTAISKACQLHPI